MIPRGQRPRGRCVVFRNADAKREFERLKRLALRGDPEALERLMRHASETSRAPADVWILVEESRSSTHPRARIEGWDVVGAYASEDAAWEEAISRMLFWSRSSRAAELRDAGEFKRAVEAWHAEQPSYPGRFYVLWKKVDRR